MMRTTLFLLAIAGLAVHAYAAFLLEIDTDGLDDNVMTYNPNFSFGGDTTTASPSVPSPAWGTSGADSLFGGDGVEFPDTYVYSYTPALDADNLIVPAGTDLGGGNLATGLPGGEAGLYRVYATWPFTTNVSGGPTQFTISTAGVPDVVIEIDQNNKGDDWVLLGDIMASDPTSPITVTQLPSEANTFVSMRAYGVMYEVVPEPATLMLLGLGSTVLLRRRRR